MKVLDEYSCSSCRWLAVIFPLHARLRLGICDDEIESAVGDVKPVAADACQCS